jgi:hypothetical protein
LSPNWGRDVTDGAYSEQQWTDAAGHRPLKGVDVNQVVLLHRHWIWANLQRRRFDELLPTTEGPSQDEAFMASECFSAMYLWYGLLWSVIEAFDEREIELRGPFAADIAEIGDTLRQCRNAVFHVPSKQNHDPRLFRLMFVPNSALTIRRISTGFGRLFIEESDARAQDEAVN